MASPLQWVSNLLRASLTVAESLLRPRTPRTIPRKRTSRWPKRTFRRKFCPKVVRTFPENCRISCFDVSETSWRDYHGIELVSEMSEHYLVSFHYILIIIMIITIINFWLGLVGENPSIRLERTPQISKVAKFESEFLKTNKDITPQICRNLQTFVW